MKKIITTVLIVTMVLSCAIVPIKMAGAEDDDEYLEITERYVDENGLEHAMYYSYDYICRDEYYEKCSDSDKEWYKHEWYYTIRFLYGKHENGIGCIPIGKVWYDTDGNMVYKVINDVVLVDKRMFDAYIDAKSYGSDNYDILFYKVPENITLNLSCANYGVYGDKLLEASWSSNNPEIAAVDKNGILTGKKQGEAVITATITSSGQKVTKTVKVVENSAKYTSKQSKYKMTSIVSYNKNGNLQWKITVKNVTSKKWKYNIANSLYISGKRLKSTNWNTTIMPGKSKTKTFTVKKSKLGKEVTDLTDDYNLGYTTSISTFR